MGFLTVLWEVSDGEQKVLPGPEGGRTSYLARAGEIADWSTNVSTRPCRMKQNHHLMGQEWDTDMLSTHLPPSLTMHSGVGPHTQLKATTEFSRTRYQSTYYQHSLCFSPPFSNMPTWLPRSALLVEMSSPHQVFWISLVTWEGLY